MVEPRRQLHVQLGALLLELVHESAAFAIRDPIKAKPGQLHARSAGRAAIANVVRSHRDHAKKEHSRLLAT